jgi:hypothetical protein
MPTKYDDDFCRDYKIPPSALTTYREEIIASEREAAAERIRLLREALGWAIHTAVNFGRDHPARDDMLAGPTKIYNDSAVILDGQSASPKDICKRCDFYEGCEHEFLHTKPITPLQEARDRGGDGSDA